MKARYLTKNSSNCSSTHAYGLLTLSSSAVIVNSKQSFSSCTRAKQCFAHPFTSSKAFGLATRSSNARLNRISGFTLIEVVVALAIFAVAAMALTKVAMQYTQSTAHSILRTKAQFVAQNEIAQMQINHEWLEGTQSKQITAQGETWQIDKRSESTISPNVQKVEVQVSLYNNALGKVESGVNHTVFYNYPVKDKQL